MSPAGERLRVKKGSGNVLEIKRRGSKARLQAISSRTRGTQSGGGARRGKKNQTGLGRGVADRVERGEERVEPGARGDGVVHALRGGEAQVQQLTKGMVYSMRRP